MPETPQPRLLPSLGLLALIIVVLVTAIYKQNSSSSVSEKKNWKEGWLELSSFQYPRRALAATATKTHLYVLGGVDAQSRYVRPVEYAPILADGRLGQWRQTQPLREGRFYLAAVNHGGYLYALGGGGGELGDNNVPLASVERAEINPDGSLQAWQHHSYLNTPRRGLKASVVDDRLYAIGGYNGTFLKSIEHLDLGASLGNSPSNAQWQLNPEQARVDRYIHAAATLGKRLFLLGGHVDKGGPMSYGDVESAAVGANGWLSPWQVAETRLLNARFIASAFALDNHLYIVGGHDGVRRLATVEMAKATASGKVGPWSPLKNLNHKRSATAIAIAGAFAETVYVAGGMDDSGVLNSVEMAQAGPGGKLGYIQHSPNGPIPLNISP